MYLQNSGLGNMVNPLLSLADAEVYGLPMLLIVGWRGEPGVKDEPQHVAQGRLTLPLLETMGIDHLVLDPDAWQAQVATAIESLRTSNRPVAMWYPPASATALPSLAVMTCRSRGAVSSM